MTRQSTVTLPALTRARAVLHRKAVQRGIAAFAALLAAAAVVAAGFWIVYGHPNPPAAQQTGAPAILHTTETTPPVAPMVAIAPTRPPGDAPVTSLPAVSVAGRPLCATELSGAQPHVAQVGNFLKTVFGVVDVGGADGRTEGDHAMGLALDLMAPDKSLGDTLANYVLANRVAFGVSYIIWQQQYNDGGGWEMMEDRGSPTQNHYDHVHVSFNPSADTSLTC